MPVARLPHRKSQSSISLDANLNCLIRRYESRNISRETTREALEHGVRPACLSLSKHDTYLTREKSQEVICRADLLGNSCICNLEASGSRVVVNLEALWFSRPLGRHFSAGRVRDLIGCFAGRRVRVAKVNVPALQEERFIWPIGGQKEGYAWEIIA